MTPAGGAWGGGLPPKVGPYCKVATGILQLFPLHRRFRWEPRLTRARTGASQLGAPHNVPRCWGLAGVVPPPSCESIAAEGWLATQGHSDDPGGGIARVARAARAWWVGWMEIRGLVIARVVRHQGGESMWCLLGSVTRGSPLGGEGRGRVALRACSASGTPTCAWHVLLARAHPWAPYLDRRE